MKKWPIIILIIVLLIIGGYFIYQRYLSTNRKAQDETPDIVELDTEEEVTHLSKIWDTKNVYWQRAFELWWEEVEAKEGEFDWDDLDSRMQEINNNNVYPIVTIKPFANWDQDACHEDSSYEAESHIATKDNPKSDQTIKVGAPCDIDAYAKFLAKAVERYDGDGEDDMPDLKIPVKYWEIMNEPSMQGGNEGGMGEELKFFVGTSDEYLEILKKSYQTIKKADPEAKVLHAGMAGMQENFLDFWRPIFDQGGGNYFDIANIHTINTDKNREDMYIFKFKEFLAEYKLESKPIFITEVQFGDLVGEPENLAEFEKLIARSTVFALGLGADKLFYIENWLFWDTEKDPENKLKVDQSALSGSTHKVYLNLVDKLNSFDKVEVLKQEYEEKSKDLDGATSSVCQYKFTNGNDVIYVLWGDAELPAEITGSLKVYDIYGEMTEVDADELTLTDSPVFVEIKS